MKQKNKNIGGFTLVELMVVVAIIAILSAGTGVLAKGMKGALVPYSSALHIDDILTGLEQDISLLERYEEVTVHFFKNYSYLVIVAKPKDYSLNLKWDKSACNGIGGAISTDDGMIFHKVGNKLSLIASNEESVCEDFMNSNENEWSYQLKNGEDFSPIIKLIHFNDNPQDSATKITSDDSSMIISAPYGKKRFYDGVVPDPNLDGTLTLTLEYNSHSREKTLN